MYALGENSIPDGSNGKFILKEEPRKRRRLENRTRILLVLLVFFIILSLVMIGLFAWAVMKTREETQITQILQADPQEPNSCRFLPKPIAFKTLPSNVKESLRELEKFIQKEIGRGQATALSANLVYMNNIIWEGGFGVMNYSDSSSKSPTPNTVYPCASVTKILTALMLFKLYNNGQVASFNVPLTTYEPRFSIRNLFHRNITIKDLASHRSGLAREAPCYPSAERNFCPYNYSTMLQRLSNLTLLRKPGSEPQYSNLGWSLLGQILAKYFGGGDYKTWMKKALLEPLGMTNSSFTLTESLISKIPVIRDNIMDWGWLAPSGGLYTTVHDLAQMEIKLFSDNFLDSEVNEEFFKEDFVFPDGVTMTGLPWEIKFYNGRMIREKTAFVYGYNSYVGAVPEMKLAFNFMCTNCIQKLDNSLKNYFRKIISTMESSIENASPKRYHLPPDTRPYLGVYNANPRLPITLQMEIRLHYKDRLAISINGDRVDTFFLHYVKPRVFRLHLNPRHPCDKLFTFGVEDDLVLFDMPSSPGGSSGGFIMDSAYPSGRTHFVRKL